jgi:two-component system sensor histidine kinase UhpB
VNDNQDHRLRLDNFIANLPCMAFRLRLSPTGEFSFPYIGDGSQDLLGIAPRDLETASVLFTQLVNPEDLEYFLGSMLNSARNLTFWTWEGRVQLPGGGKWLSLGSSPQATPAGEVEWEGIMIDVTKTKLQEIEFARSQEQLREFSSHIQDAKEQERMRIAREVHDEIGGLLTAIKMDLAWLKHKLPADNALLQDKTSTIENLVDKAATAARNLAHSLRPGYLDSFGIVAAIEMEANEFQQRTGIRCILEHSDENIDLNPDVSIALFRIFQEALTNIMKHAHATTVTVAIHDHAHGVDLTIGDDGCGFADSERLKPRSFGLRGIQERVAHFGGQVQISSTPGKGTTVAVNIPHSGTESQADGALPQKNLF